MNSSINYTRLRSNRIYHKPVLTCSIANEIKVVSNKNECAVSNKIDVASNSNSYSVTSQLNVISNKHRVSTVVNYADSDISDHEDSNNENGTTSEASSESDDQEEDEIDEKELIKQMNNLAVNGSENSWTLLTTQRSKPKLYSNGYSYVIDKANGIYWKCSNKDCKGRGTSSVDLKPPFYITQVHNHMPDTTKTLVNKQMEQLKIKATSCNDKPRVLFKQIVKDNSDEVLNRNPNAAAIRQRVNRYRKKNKIVFKEPKDLFSLDIPDSLKKTY